VVGATGNDAASSAQSKRTGGGETARLESNWGELGQVADERNAGDERGASTGGDVVVSDMAGGCDAGGSEMVRCWGFRGELGLWDAFRGRFAGSCCVRRRSGAAGGGPELGRAGDLVVVDEHVDDDVAVVLGVLGRTGVWGASWGEVGGVRGFLGLRSESGGSRGRFVEQTTYFDECVCSSSCGSVCWAVDRRWGSLVA
jgi:hypothetical protein